MDPFIAQHLRGVSRTYAIAVPMLPEPLADAVGVAYLLMRIVDTIEDATELTPAERCACFERLDRALGGEPAAGAALARPIGDTDDERALMRDAPEVFARVLALKPAWRGAICRCARQMMEGVRQLAARAADRGLPYPGVTSVPELREYCYYVAGVVGEMLCTLMADWLESPELEDRRDVAVELGIGLQLVNVLKDLSADAGHGRRYLPVTAATGPSHPEIYRTVLAEARRSLARGIDFVLALPATACALRQFSGLPIAWGGLTLAQAERDPAQPKIGRTVVQDSIATFPRLAGDDAALRCWLEEVVTGRRGAVIGKDPA